MQTKKKEVDEAVFGARVFYFIFHFLGLLIAIIYDCKISQDLKEFRLFFPLLVLGLFLASAYFFLTCGEKPGFAERSPTVSFKSVDQDNVCLNSEEDQTGNNIQNNEKNFSELKNKGSSNNEEEEVIDIEMQQKGDQIKEKMLAKGSEQSDKNINIKQVKNSELNEQHEEDDDDEDNNPNLVVKKFYCPKCNLRQKYRTKHCDLCGRCINKFDHHCFWIGGCVGELNHRTFWSFLFLQTVFLMLVFKVFWDGMDNYSRRDPNSGEWVHDNAYGAFATFAFICFIFILFTGILCCYHTFLILTNQSTWEHASRSRITYTQIYPKGYYPFDKGIIENIKTVFFHNDEIRDWQLPDLKQAELEAQNNFNYCENEYYSCC